MTLLNRFLIRHRTLISLITNGCVFLICLTSCKEDESLELWLPNPQSDIPDSVLVPNNISISSIEFFISYNADGKVSSINRGTLIDFDIMKSLSRENFYYDNDNLVSYELIQFSDEGNDSTFFSFSYNGNELSKVSKTWEGGSEDASFTTLQENEFDSQIVISKSNTFEDEVLNFKNISGKTQVFSGSFFLYSFYVFETTIHSLYVDSGKVEKLTEFSTKNNNLSFPLKMVLYTYLNNTMDNENYTAFNPSAYFFLDPIVKASLEKYPVLYKGERYEYQIDEKDRLLSVVNSSHYVFKINY